MIIVSIIVCLITGFIGRYVARIKQHLHHSFNENGDIVREDYYFNPASLPK